MKKVFVLSADEAEQVVFSTQFISDRKQRPGYTKPGEGEYEESYAGAWRRRDMFWITTELDGENLGSYCVDPRMTNPLEFDIHVNYCKINPPEIENIVRNRASKWFLKTPAYKQQVEWATELKARIESDVMNGFKTRRINK